MAADVPARFFVGENVLALGRSLARKEVLHLGRIWEHLGFRRHRDGVFVCDPSAGEFDSALNDPNKTLLG